MRVLTCVQYRDMFENTEQLSQKIGRRYQIRRKSRAALRTTLGNFWWSTGLTMDGLYDEEKKLFRKLKILQINQTNFLILTIDTMNFGT